MAIKRLRPGDRPTALYHYSVTGQTAFPLDMLRHDSAWPASPADTAKIEYVLRQNELRTVWLQSHSRPSPERWRSAGWTVADAVR